MSAPDVLTERMKSWSWWDETPWPEIREFARLSLSPKQFREWQTRPDVIERAARAA